MFQPKMRRLLMLSACCVLVCASHPLRAQNPKEEKSEKMRQRLEQLFVWRVSDRLQLTPSEETKFSSEYKKLSDERAQLSAQMESALDQIEKKKANKAMTGKLIKDYESALRKYNLLQSKEMETMGKLFDHKKLVEYVLLKREMTQKFKDVLTHGQTKAADNKTFKDPEVIQEK